MRTVFTVQTFAVGNRRCWIHARWPRRNNPCQGVSLHSKSGLTGASSPLCLQPGACATHLLSRSQCSTGAPAGCPNNLKRATKLLHITQALLQSSDGRCSRQGRYNGYTRGELVGVIDWLVVFAGRPPHKAREGTPEARRICASKLAHERRCINKAPGALISPPAAPRDSRRLATLRSKHPTEDPAAIATGKARAEQHAGILEAGEQEQQPNVITELLYAQDQIPEMENLFEKTAVKAVIKEANHKAWRVRLDSATAICRLRCAMNWSRISRRLRRLSFLVAFCPKYSGHCTRALTFPRWG